MGRHTGGVARGLPWTATTSARSSAAAEAGVRHHVVAPARVDVREQPVGDPPEAAYFAARLRTPVPETFVLDMDEGRLLGRHVAVVTPGGRLDYESSHYFGLADWREHPVHLNPWPARPERIDGTVAVLAARGTGHNYYHFLIDALPRLGILDEAFPGLRPDLWV
ncbi:hypothetical protein, partial [Nocardioides albidus]|uniref:hypothetical protein n=1 Tax=Nocardioides albidus TaxID=1517589 RepID=UPI0019600DF2